VRKMERERLKVSVIPLKKIGFKHHFESEEKFHMLEIRRKGIPYMGSTKGESPIPQTYFWV